MAAEEVLRKKGLINWAVEPRLLGASDQRRVWLKNMWIHMPLFVRPLLYWMYRYFIKGAFLDGRHGFAFTVNQALWFRMVCDMKVQELELALARGSLTTDDLWAEFGARSPSGDVVGRRDAATGKT